MFIMKKTNLKLITIGLSSAFLIASTVPSIAYADVSNSYTSEVNNVQSTTSTIGSLSEEQQSKVYMMASLGNDLTLLDDGKLALAVDTATLKTNHNLTDDDVAFIESSIANYNAYLDGSIYNNNSGGILESKAKFDGAYIYLTYDEVMWIVNQAASFGPGVIAGLMASLLSVYPGIGTVIGGIVGFLGAASILGAMQAAVSKHRGIKIGIGGISNW
ncbi:hypothetical protein [Streptococcus agalactiae]|uniref:hypothetical protein n=1 Tax=Streptococcus agalactiae TaxID=1311 RepID=UPI002161B142|nr:hypothetical protein [Streptococcus agalactiae]